MIPLSPPHQSYRRARPRAALAAIAVMMVVSGPPVAHAADYINHSSFQAVDNNGMSTFNTSVLPLPPEPFYLTGIVLNNPEDMLNGAAAYNTTLYNMGGQWQIFIQSAASGDWGGTCLWMGQNYGNLPFIGEPSVNNYQNSAWDAEVLRLNYCGGTETQPFRAGDLIKVYARGTKWYAGKRNVNEEHSTAAAKDFDIRVLQKNAGLPTPTKINLAQVRTAGNVDIFQATDPDGNGAPVTYVQADGGEKYQAQRVMLENVRLKSGEAAKWALGAKVLLTDTSGREFPLRIGLSSSLSTTPPGGTFNVTGIVDQEAVTSPSSKGIDGYQLWLMNAADVVGLTPGDFDGDGFVGAGDYAVLQQHWGQNVTPCSLSSGDPSGDGFVGAEDYAVLQANWGSGTPPAAPQAVPEPATWSVLLAGMAAVGLVRLRRWRRSALAAVLLAGLAGTASADGTLHFAPVNNSSVPALQNYVTQDLMLNTSTDWLNSQLLVTLTNGSAYQDAVGGNTAPNPAFFTAFPSLQFDTFVAGGQSSTAADVIGGAVNLGGSATAKCDATGVNLAWGTNATSDIGDLTLARLSLSNDAQGTWKALMLVKDSGSPNGYATTSYSGPIVGGAMQVPEPGSLAMLAAGGLCAALLWRRRRPAGG